MPEKKNKKVSFTEEDAAALTQRYDATTVVALLQEVARCPKSKIDWNELVKKTSTGISNAREYQMLWRHLAYRDALPESFDDGAEPLDDDSDLECELEALPPASVDSASEAAACVKVMIASRTLSESTPSSSTIEAPLTINVPVFHSSRNPIENLLPSNSMQGTSIIFPVTVQRQTLPTVSPTDGVETKGLVGGNMASKRKRKAWSEEEDMQLRAAVKTWGEGNWATMAKGDNFPIKRSPTQLAQRWSILRKKDGSANSGTISTSAQYSTAEQLATRHSLSLALDMPFKKLTAPVMTDPVKTYASVKGQVQVRNTTERVASSFVPAQHPSQQALSRSSDPPAKPKLEDEKPILKCNPISNPMVRSTTPGTQIISPSNTTSHPKVAQVRNMVDTKPASSSLTKSSISADLPSDPKDKHVTPMANAIPLKQDVNPTEEFRASDPSSTPKEKVEQNGGPKRVTESQIDSNQEKERSKLDKEKSMPIAKTTIGDNVSKDKANPGACEEQGSVKNSNFNFNAKSTENSNLDKESQVLDRDKRMNSINESLNDQNKHVNLPAQAECSKTLDLPR